MSFCLGLDRFRALDEADEGEEISQDRQKVAPFISSSPATVRTHLEKLVRVGVLQTSAEAERPGKPLCLARKFATNRYARCKLSQVGSSSRASIRYSEATAHSYRRLVAVAHRLEQLSTIVKADRGLLHSLLADMQDSAELGLITFPAYDFSVQCPAHWCRRNQVCETYSWRAGNVISIGLKHH